MRYFFHIYMGGQEIADHEGTDLHSLDAVRAEAQAIVKELRREFCETADDGAHLEVVNSAGATVMALPLSGHH